jgi:hypothetical protein
MEYLNRSALEEIPAARLREGQRLQSGWDNGSGNAPLA